MHKQNAPAAGVPSPKGNGLRPMFAPSAAAFEPYLKAKGYASVEDVPQAEAEHQAACAMRHNKLDVDRLSGVLGGTQGAAALHGQPECEARKPFGMHGVEICWAKLCAPPVTTVGQIRCELSTRTPRTFVFEAHKCNLKRHAYGKNGRI